MLVTTEDRLTKAAVEFIDSLKGLVPELSGSKVALVKFFNLEKAVDEYKRSVYD